MNLQLVEIKVHILNDFLSCRDNPNKMGMVVMKELLFISSGSGISLSLRFIVSHIRIEAEPDFMSRGAPLLPDSENKHTHCCALIIKRL